MKKNMGTADRIFRLAVVAALVALFATGTISGIWGTVALVAAGIFALTSLFGFCPLYTLVGIKTCKTS